MSGDHAMISTRNAISIGTALLLLSGFALTAHSSEKSRWVVYLEALGFRELMEMQLERNRSDLEQQLSTMVLQFRSQLPELPAELTDELDTLIQPIAEQTTNMYTVDELLNIYAEPFDRNYSGDEIDEAIKQLSQPDGKLLVLTINEAVSGLVEFQSERQKAAMENATNQIVTRLKEMIEKRRAERSSP